MGKAEGEGGKCKFGKASRIATRSEFFPDRVAIRLGLGTIIADSRGQEWQNFWATEKSPGASTRLAGSVK
jgi:hypothetical protein